MNEICREISALTPQAQRACNLFMAECRKQGLQVLITETYRSQGRQNYLYEQGRIRGGNVVTWTRNSRHTSRRAWDVCKNVKGQEFADKVFFMACGEVADKLGITWGGTWKQADTPHFEIDKDWKEIMEDVAMTDMERKEFEYLKSIVNNQASELEYYKTVIDGMAERIVKLEHPVVYNYIDENMPSWARPTIKKLVDNGTLVGDGTGALGLTMGDLKILTIMNR